MTDLKDIALSLLIEMNICSDCHDEFLAIIGPELLSRAAVDCSNLDFDDQFDDLVSDQKKSCHLVGHRDALLQFLVRFQNRVYYHES